MEMDILYLIQNCKVNWMDDIMTTLFNDIVGSKGQIWILLGIVLLIIPRTRKTGLCVLASYILAYFAGDLLKELIKRPRPCDADPTVQLLITRPTSFSCPSVHSMLAFASAGAVFCFHRKTGIIALVFALLIGLSRMYFFVHYPTDVLLGAVLGFGIAVLVCLSASLWEKSALKEKKE